MQKIYLGMKIFNKYEPNCDISAGHDEIFCGSKTTKEKATPEELAELDKLGWIWQEYLECYQHFT